MRLLQKTTFSGVNRTYGPAKSSFHGKTALYHVVQYHVNVSYVAQMLTCEKKLLFIVLFESMLEKAKRR